MSFRTQDRNCCVLYGSHFVRVDTEKEPLAQISKSSPKDSNRFKAWKLSCGFDFEEQSSHHKQEVYRMHFTEVYHYPENMLASSLNKGLGCEYNFDLLASKTRSPWGPSAQCFDICNVMIMRGNKGTATKIIPFLYEHYWSREPSVSSLWMNLDNDYIRFLTDKYAHTGDRYLAIEPMERTGECKIVGVCVANKIFPWEPRELEEWGDATCSIPERSRMYFTAHCYSSPNLWKKYNVPYIYEIEVLTTANEVTGQGVATLLLNYALKEALLLRHPLIQVICYSHYVTKICARCGMKKEWSMRYEDFVDSFGQSVFYPRAPHNDCEIYIKKFDQKEATALPCLPEVY